jgi:hypothetical protein
LDTQAWNDAEALLQPLDRYFNARGLHEEARRWVDRARVSLEAGDGTPPALATPAGALWIFVVGSQAIRELKGGRSAEAERTYLDILQTLQVQPPSQDRRSR